MKILLFGKNGQVGWELQRSLAPLGEIIAPGKDSQELCGDFTDPDRIAATVRTVSPDIIVNAAAHTAVDKCETDAGPAHLINATTPGILAQEAKKSGAWLIHYSTDYVFDGSGKKPWTETDATSPLNIYGKTKAKGEEAIQASGCLHLIFRTSWVFGAYGNNFARNILRLAKVRDQLTVINDQTGAPTNADLLADITAHAIRTAIHHPQVSGLYHATASGETTWYDYARLVLDTARQAGIVLSVAPANVTPIPGSAFPTLAKRPMNSRMDTIKLCHTFGLTLPAWQAGVSRMLTEILHAHDRT